MSDAYTTVGRLRFVQTFSTGRKSTKDRIVTRSVKNIDEGLAMVAATMPPGCYIQTLDRLEMGSQRLGWKRIKRRRLKKVPS